MGSECSTLRDDHKLLKDLDGHDSLSRILQGFGSFNLHRSEGWEKASEQQPLALRHEQPKTLFQNHKPLEHSNSKNVSKALSKEAQTSIPLIDFHDKDAKDKQGPRKARRSDADGSVAKEVRSFWQRVKKFVTGFVEDDVDLKVGRDLADTADIKV